MRRIDVRNPIHRFALAAALACASAGASAAAPTAPGATSEAVFARVAGTTITRAQYEAAVAAAVRGRFYHGKAPEAEVQKLRREVGEKLVDEVLLLDEAKRRKIGPDAAAVQKQIDAWEARYSKHPEWAARSAEIQPQVRRQLERENVLARLEAEVRDVPAAPAKKVEAYYAANPDKFTEPEQVRVSLILMKIDPSSPRAKWEAAKVEAAGLVKSLRAGADFAALAAKHSGDPSAARGGDLGYLHRGMLPDEAQGAVDAAAVGDVIGPLVVLEGVAVLRLEARKLARPQPYASATERARQLLRREQADAAWRELVEQLRKQHPAVVDETVYANVAAAGGPGRTAASAR